MSTSRLTLIFIFIILKLINSKEVIWETSLGTLIGSVRTSLSGYDYYAFEGVPFAKPPLGELRFKAPVLAGPWNGTLNATYKASHCYQAPVFSEIKDAIKSATPESEDCLYLNIYTRNLNKNPTKNILMAIFGGNYIIGNTDQLGPDYLTDEEDLIFVTPNYRLNIFGFLSFFDSTLGIPGNAGAKDIIMALQWIHNHIAEFGGDPDKVTIIGCSNAGQIINLLMMHPTASKLFRHAITQSGSALLGLLPIEIPNHEYLARSLNYKEDVRNDRAFFEHINSFSGEDLSVAYSKYCFFMAPKQNYFLIGIVIESPLNNPTPFLTEDPDILIAKGAFARIPYLTSFTFQEGGSNQPLLLERTKNYTNFLSELPKWFSCYFTPNEMQVLHEEVKRFYYGNEEPRPENSFLALNLMGDSSFIYTNFLTWRTMAFVTNFTMPIYMYFFNYTSPLNTFLPDIKKLAQKYTNYYNITCIHCDEIGYIYNDYSILSAKYRADDHETIRKVKTFKRVIMNFVRTGIPKSFDLDDPTSQFDWKPLHTKNFLDLEYLAIREPKLELETFKDSIYANRLQLWDRIYRKFKDRCAPRFIYLE